MRTVHMIIRESLAASGHGGLFNNRLDCACELSDLAPCDAMELRCEAGYKHARANDDFVVTDSPEPMTDS